MHKMHDVHPEQQLTKQQANAKVLSSLAVDALEDKNYRLARSLIRIIQENYNEG